jgi:hypothetical protein
MNQLQQLSLASTCLLLLLVVQLLPRHLCTSIQACIECC